MGLFDSIFGRRSGPPREEWGTVVLAISVGFEASRKELYQRSAELLSKNIFEGQGPPVSVFLDDVQGLKIKAFQIYLATYLIAKRRYMKAHLGKDFADLLWAQILGNQILEQVREFKAAGPLPDAYKLFCFLAADIFGRPAEPERFAVLGLKLLSLLGAEFVADCIAILAIAFKEPVVDQVVREEIKPFEQIISGGMERFRELVDKNPKD